MVGIIKVTKTLPDFRHQAHQADFFIKKRYSVSYRQWRMFEPYGHKKGWDTGTAVPLPHPSYIMSLRVSVRWPYFCSP